MNIVIVMLGIIIGKWLHVKLKHVKYGDAIGWIIVVSFILFACWYEEFLNNFI